eukprot:Polyplicarium_translucidae@DN1610_c0_g1_i2.p1
MRHLKEDEIYRIDHYLGKEMVLNMVSLRFANSFFSPIWHHSHVSCVRITFKEDIGTLGRGGYFDTYGIIRDVLQNHLLQMLTLIAMETPASLRDDDVRDEKVKVLKQMAPLTMDNVVLGQYTASADGTHGGYLDDPSVPPNSRTATFAAAVLFINNERWHRVPFILKAGKGLEERMTEIRIQLKEVPGSLFGQAIAQNELVIRIQPREAIYMKCLTKKWGLGGGLTQTELDLTVSDRFDMERMPEAYERLLLDTIRGDKQNFVRTDELREAWRVFTPVLHAIENQEIEPIPYSFGSRGPPEAYDLISRFNYTYTSGYKWDYKVTTP